MAREKSTAEARHVRGRREDEPFASPFDSHGHVFVFGAKKAAEAGVGEREYDGS